MDFERSLEIGDVIRITVKPDIRDESLDMAFTASRENETTGVYRSRTARLRLDDE